MIDPPEHEADTEPELEPTGLVDPRVIHPEPEEIRPGTRPGAEPGSEEAGHPTALPPDPDSPSSEGAEGPGIVDPRTSIPGPDLGPERSDQIR